MPLTAVLMNDTREEGHFGCLRVMRTIEHNLEARGIEVTARSLLRNDWPSDRAFLEAASTADIIIINGEGTLHHGTRHGELLLKIAEHPVRYGKPIALINAMYQENPSEWRRYLDRIDLISPRDSWSAAALRELTGRDIEHLPDLSMAGGFHPGADTSNRTMLTIGESVVREARRDLIAIFQRRPETFLLPIVGTLKSPQSRLRQPLRGLRKLYVELHNAAFRARNRRAIFARSEADYVDALLRSTLHVSGRFHAICFALTTKTPFLALSSNAWKIEALVEDMGIAKWRIEEAGRLEELIREPLKLVWSEEEHKRIGMAVESGVTRTAKMFDQIAQLARENQNA